MNFELRIDMSKLAPSEPSQNELARVISEIASKLHGRGGSLAVCEWVPLPIRGIAGESVGSYRFADRMRKVKAA